MSKQNSLTHTYLQNITLISVLLTILFGVLWVSTELYRFAADSKKIRQEYQQSQRASLEKEVRQVIAYISFMKEQAENRLKDDLMERTMAAHETATYIYETNKHTRSKEEIGLLVHDALVAQTWDEGRGYIFAHDMAGNQVITRNNPNLEGTNTVYLQDSEGTYFVQDILKIGRSPEGEGLVSYTWNKPGEPDLFLPKISYVKYFAPLDWIIGNGKYLPDSQEEIQEQIIGRISHLRYAYDGYFFVGTWEGDSLSGPGSGRNLLDLEDRNGLKVVQELIKAARNGGGFVDYIMPDIDGKREAPKISYTAGIPDWKWYVGTGAYKDEGEKLITSRQKELTQKVISFTLLALLALSLVLALVSVYSRRYIRKIENNLNIFSHFFDRAASRSQVIDQEQVHFSEFRNLAVAANTMIAERTRTLESLHESDRRFVEVIDAAHIPMVIFEENGQAEFINHKFTDLFGYTKNDILTIEHWWELAYPDTNYRKKVKNRWNGIVNNALEQGQPVEGSATTVTCKNGSTRIVEHSYTPVGKWRLTTFRDITKERADQEEKMYLQSRLVQAQKMKTIALMAGGVAHDLNNILTGIVGYPDLILRQLPEDSSLRPSIIAIQDSGIRAAEVVADLLTLSRGAASTREIRNLNSIIPEFLASPEGEQVRNMYPNIVLNYTPDPHLLNISCSSIHVRKCLMNLVFNAAEAIGDKGSITIRTKNHYIDKPLPGNQFMETGEYAVVSVADTGPGIDQHDIDMIFEPFYSRKIMGRSGTGIGLTIVWNTLQDHGGTITVASDSNGTLFSLYFPATREQLEDKNQIEETGFEDLQGNQETILVIDDERQQRDIATQMLQMLNYIVSNVSSGEEAIAYLKKKKVDLLVLDMVMSPGIDGRETYEKILADHPAQKAIIASGFSRNEEVQRTLLLGASEFIRKPYTLAQLGSAIKKALNEEYHGQVGSANFLAEDSARKC